jgi:hypothetical protein
MPHVRPIALAVLLGMYGVPAQAQPADEPQLSERIERALRDMMEGLEPALGDALEYMRSLGAIDDPLNYEMPEVLPNGDIIIRRREDAPELEPEVPGAPPEADDEPPSDPEEGIRI